MAVLIYLLAERGQVRFDEPVATYWPKFARHGKSHVTIRQVLQHRSGLVQSMSIGDALTIANWGTFTHRVARSRLALPPGDGPAYKPPSYGFIVGEIVHETLLQGKWRVQILCAMRSEPVCIGQLARLIPGTSKKILAQHLRKLEVNGIVNRRDLSDTVLHVEYELKEDVKEQVCTLLADLAQWGSFYLELRK